MAWSRLDDGLDEHSKVEVLLEDDELRGLAALGLWTLTVANSARRLTDGRVSVTTLRRIAPRYGKGLAQRLVEVGLYDELDGTDLAVHDYLDFNPSRAEVEARREAQREGGRKGAARRWSDGSTDESTHRSSHGPSDNSDIGPTHKDPTKDLNAPVPEPVPVPRTASSGLRDRTRPSGVNNIVEIARSTNGEEAA